MLDGLDDVGVVDTDLSDTDECAVEDAAAGALGICFDKVDDVCLAIDEARAAAARDRDARRAVDECSLPMSVDSF